MLVSLAAQAADEVFLLNVPGITGDVTLKDFAGWISVTSFSESFANSGARGGGGGGGARRIGCQELRIVKPLDLTSPELTLAVASGHLYRTIELVALRTAGGAPQEFLRFTLSNALFTSVAFAGNSDASARTESLEVRPTRVEVKYTPQRADGGIGAPASTTVDCGSIF
jgi:type VI secretion system secreted protein Hcp